MNPVKHITAYELNARYIPAIITSMPFLLGGYFLLRNEETKDIMAFLLSLKFLGYLSLSFIGLYFYAQLIRTISKFYERKYFHDASGFPTTYFMLYANREYSEAFKGAFRDRVKKEFGFVLLSKNEEDTDPSEGQRRLNDVTKQIILKVGDGRLVGKHNQWYGFFRNLIGGTTFALIGSMVNILVGIYILHHKGLVILSCLMVVVYGMLLLFRRSLIVQHAEAYARQLYAEFMMERLRPQKTIKSAKEII